jgi:CDP-4-dehydro-6-deoxyglucose reductase, E3
MTLQQTPLPSSPLRNAYIDALDRIGPDIIRLALRTEVDTTMAYEAGQYIAIHLPDGETRCYSIARAWQPGRPLELHIRLRPDGLFSAWLMNALQTGVSRGLSLRISGPYGDCVWRHPHPQEMTVMLATGTGIAPLAALLEHALATDTTHPITLYWGGRDSGEMYLSSHFEALARQHPNFHYIPVLDSQNDAWTGRRGYIQECAAMDHPDLRTARVYACGSPAMVAGARRLLTEQCELNAERFHADAFEPSIQSNISQSENTMLVQVRRDTPQRCSQSLTVAAEGSLLTALRHAGLLNGVCGGHASCGTCRIKVRPDWYSRLPPPNRTEARLLATLDGTHPHHRLACQIQLDKTLNGICLVMSQTTV